MIDCPVDGTCMQKDVQGSLVLDRCPQCKSYFISDDELNELKKSWYDQGFRDGGGRGTQKL